MLGFVSAWRAKPGDLLAALRNMTYRKLVPPSLIGEWMSSPKHLPKLMGIPAIIFGIILMIRAAMVGSFFPLTEDGRALYGNLFLVISRLILSLAWCSFASASVLAWVSRI